MTEPLLKVRGVQTFYGKIQAPKGIDMDVNADANCVPASCIESFLLLYRNWSSTPPSAASEKHIAMRWSS